MNKVDIIRKHVGNDDFYDMNGTLMLTKMLNAMEEYHQEQLKNYSTSNVSMRAEMRKKAITVFELTKGFTGETTDNAMKTALEMADYVIRLTNVSPRVIDWEEMRNNFFNECTTETPRKESGKKVNMAPHDMFEWFKREITEYVG